jgi:hypothetical protein
MQSNEQKKSLSEAVTESVITVTVKRGTQEASGKIPVSEYQFLKANHNVDPIEELATQLIEELDRGI